MYGNCVCCAHVGRSVRVFALCAIERLSSWCALVWVWVPGRVGRIVVWFACVAGVSSFAGSKGRWPMATTALWWIVVFLSACVVALLVEVFVGPRCGGRALLLVGMVIAVIAGMMLAHMIVL